ncbi:MAG: diaminopimelate decarboxylase [Pseudomonadota bacterium]
MRAPFQRRDDRLWAESVDLAAVADAYGTPCFVYSRQALESQWRGFDDAFGDRSHLVCYAVKANSNLAVLNVLARLGSGFDIVSAGELARVLAAGGKPARIVFSGVGKQSDEIEAGLGAGIRCFNVESRPELERIAAIAAANGVQAPVSIRVNPDVDAETHPYISTGLRENKFGVPIETAKSLYRWAMAESSLDVHGVDCHIGSQMVTLGPIREAVMRVFELVGELGAEGINVHDVNLGGGLGIDYQGEAPPDPGTYVGAVLEGVGDHPATLLIEPGRSIAGNAGVMLTRVEYLKTNDDRHFAIVDAAMNDFIRPALYQGWSSIEPVITPGVGATEAVFDVVGPVCESADFLGKERPLALAEGALLAVMSSGAYGFVMSSNYNSRCRAPEVMVDGEDVHLVRRRETVEELFAHEAVLPD